MAIQNRRGAYENFDPEKLKSGERATVISGDPNANDGRAVYECFEPGVIKRMATYEDMVESIDLAAGDVAKQAADKATASAEANVSTAIKGANTAATNAQTVANTVQRKLDNGDFIGPQGPQGLPGSIENLSSQPINFVEAATAANIRSGDTMTILFGKLRKFQVDTGLNTENLNKVVNWIAARNKVLWEGTWAVGSTGTINVPDWDKYSLFLITNSDISTGVMAREGNRIAGLSGYSYNGNSIIMATNFIVTGNAWKMDQDIVKSLHTSGGNHGTKNTSIAITKIVGLEPIPEKI